MMNMHRYYTLKLCLLLNVFATFLSGTIGVVYITTECPESYTQGVKAVVKCYVDTAAVSSAACYQPPDTLSVRYSKTNALPTTLCDTPYPGSCTNAKPDCGCMSSLGGRNVYQASFAPDTSTHNGVNLECSLNCGEDLQTNQTGKCQAIFVVSPTTVTTVASSTSATVRLGSTASSTHALTTGLIVSIVMSRLVSFF